MKKRKARKAGMADKKKGRAGAKDKVPVFLIGLFTAVFLATVIGLGVVTYKLLYRSDYFLIKESRIEWLDEPISRRPYEKLRSLGAGQNIFQFKIDSLADRLLVAYPGLKELQIKRDFPDRLTLRVRPRVPVAQVGETSFYLVDKEGVILTELRDTMQEGLPVISGVGWRFFVKVGKADRSLRMQRALKVLEAVYESNFSKRDKLTKIDVSDYRNILFFIEDGLKIKLGHANFKERIKRLDEVLSSMNIDKEELEYIDLRFDDIVMGMR